MSSDPTQTPAGALPPPPNPPTSAGARDRPPTVGTEVDGRGFAQLDPRALTLGLIAGSLSWVMFAAPVTVGVVVAAFFASWSGLTALLVLGAATLLLLVLAVVMIWMEVPRFRRYRYRADEYGLEIHRGVLWRSRIYIPRSRIQHTDVNQGPIERQLGLAKLVVHTAGTVRASTTISGLAHATALEIRASLSDEGEGADGV